MRANIPKKYQNIPTHKTIKYDIDNLHFFKYLQTSYKSIFILLSLPALLLQFLFNSEKKYKCSLRPFEYYF